MKLEIISQVWSSHGSSTETLYRFKQNRVRANNPIVEYLRYESLNSEQKIYLFFNKIIKYQY